MSTRQQEERSHEIKVGLTILVGLVIIIFIIFAVGSQQGILEDRYTLIVYVARVNGLQTGAPVRLNGVRVGSVVGIGFTDDLKNQNIKVTLEILTSVQNRIRKDSEAYIGTLGLLGDKFVSITTGSPDQPVLGNGQELVGMDPVDVEKLIDESVNAFNQVKQMTLIIKEIMDKINAGKGTVGMLVNDATLYRRLTSSLEFFQNLQKELDSSHGTLSRILRDSTMYDELYTFLKNANVLADSLVNGSGSAAKFVNDPLLYDTIIADLDQVAQLLDKMRQGDGTVGRAISDPKLFNDLIRVIAQLDSLAKDIRENPKRYVTVKVF
jgi:phospholipid/cholesterol/gamma-HCH transport system substrate-binding protein